MTNIYTKDELQERSKNYYVSKRRNAGWGYSVSAGILMAFSAAGAATGIIDIVENISNEITTSNKQEDALENGNVIIKTDIEVDKISDLKDSLMNWGHFTGTLGTGLLAFGCAATARRRFDSAKRHERGDYIPYDTSIAKREISGSEIQEPS